MLQNYTHCFNCFIHTHRYLVSRTTIIMGEVDKVVQQLIKFKKEQDAEGHWHWKCELVT